MTIQDHWSLLLWRSFLIDVPIRNWQKGGLHMIAFYFISLFLFVYIDQHGPYLNIFDVVLLSAAGMFVLFIASIIIMSIIDSGKK